MITVIRTKDGFEQISGNPTLKSLDGERKAPLRTIMHESWTADDRAAYGVFLVEPMAIPDGKRPVGQPRYEADGFYGVVQVYDLEDMPLPKEPAPTAVDDLRTDMEAMAKRLAELEKWRASFGAAPRG